MLKPFRKSVRAARRSILCMFSHIDALAHTRAICTCCFSGKVISRTSCLVTTWEDLLLTLHDASCTLCTPNSLVSSLISSWFAHTSPISTYFHKPISNCFEILFEDLVQTMSNCLQILRTPNPSIARLKALAFAHNSCFAHNPFTHFKSQSYIMILFKDYCQIISNIVYTRRVRDEI